MLASVSKISPIDSLGEAEAPEEEKAEVEEKVADNGDSFPGEFLVSLTGFGACGNINWWCSDDKLGRQSIF